MNKAIGSYIIKNGQLLPANSIVIPVESSAYEVIRVVDACPVFVEDHFQRLLHSASVQFCKTNVADLKLLVLELIKANGIVAGNIRIELHQNQDFVFQIKHSYPSEHDYLSGVALGMLPAERVYPEYKIVQQCLRNAADDAIRHQNCFEVLLINRDGLITEGSRSNVFFVRNNILLTAPLTMVLNGITRQKVMSIARRLKLDVTEQAIHQDDLALCDAAFISGTSPKVLPVCCIGSLRFDPTHPLTGSIMQAYDNMIVNYINNAGRKTY